ncbi:hypothetical protein ABZ260_13165 [Streptosporangium sp. NPDC006013]|uniref:ABC transporter permease subunit n=1 Tax=Streptosporangium sp. NPDC006013 TaxID=3155596 RepID=UPI0033A63B10
MTQLIWNGLFVGSFYALVALGYSMVYGIIKLLNFAHGDLYMLGAFAGFAILGAVGGVSSAMALPLLLAVLLATMVVTGLAGVALESDILYGGSGDDTPYRDRGIDALIGGTGSGALTAGRDPGPGRQRDGTHAESAYPGT